MRLLADANNACRVYELCLIDRPGDLWNYVTVRCEAAPRRVLDKFAEAQAQQREEERYENHRFDEDAIPLARFDRFFYYAWDDTEPEDSAWLGFRESDALERYLQQLLGMVELARQTIGFNDLLIDDELARIRLHRHALDRLPRNLAIAECRTIRRMESGLSEAFYQKLHELLRDPERVSVACQFSGDFRILRMLATEQRRRAEATGHDLRHALRIGVLGSARAYNDTWGAEMDFYSEGLSRSDLFICAGQDHSTSVKKLIEAGHRIPGRHAFCASDQGDIRGYNRTCGDGWWLYTLKHLDNRRQSLGWSFNDGARCKPVLAFNYPLDLVFAHERALIVVGPEVSETDREKLAGVISQWERAGGDPLLIVFGSMIPFEAARCRHLVMPDVDPSDGAQRRWLVKLLHMRRRWIDIAILLHSPEWICANLAIITQRRATPWRTHFLGVGDTGKIVVDKSLEGDWAEQLEVAANAAR